MAEVQLKLYAMLRQHIGGAPSIYVEVEQGQTVEQVLIGLGVPPDQTRIIFIDNRPADLSATLTGGEQINVFPAVGGG